MKKIIAPFLILILMSSIVFAVGVGNVQASKINANNQEIDDVKVRSVSVKEEGSAIQATVRSQIRRELIARNVTELKEMIQQRQQEMDEELQNVSNKYKQKVFMNQNRVRLAVHSLLAMENLTSGIGKNISAIAREFNNSVQATIRVEERIEKRNRLTRFLLGGDSEAAEEMEQEVNRNQGRIQELKRLKQACNCTDEIKTMLQEQLQNMELEQDRLRQLVQNERKSKGLLGWLWK